MFNPKKLASMVKRRVPSSPLTTEKGHFVIYTVDHKRFEVPLSYLQNAVFQELLRISEEELGIPSKAPMTLLCDAVSMEYMVLLVKRGVTQDLEVKSLLDSIVASTYSDLVANHEYIIPDMVVCDC